MKKEFVPYEQALALKEIGFDERCLSFWTNNPKYKGDNIQLCITDGIDGYPPNSISFKQDFLIEGEVLAPLYQQAFRWFKEKHNLHSYIVCNCSVNEILSYDWIIHKLMNTGKSRDENFITDYEQTFEEAELECLKKLIEIVKNK